MVRPTINSTKHINMLSPSTTTSGTITNQTFIDAVATPTTEVHVREGAIIKAIYCEFWLTSDDTAAGSFSVNVEKINTTQTDMTFTEGNTLGDYSNKKNVLYITRGLTSAEGGTPVPALRQWIAIPKSKQRFGLGDQLNINFSAIANGLTRCGFVLFKEYY